MQKISTVEELQNIQDSKFEVEVKSEAYWELIDGEIFEEIEDEVVDSHKRQVVSRHVVKRLSDGVLFRFLTYCHDTDGLNDYLDLEVTKVYPHKVVKIEYRPEPQTV